MGEGGLRPALSFYRANFLALPTFEVDSSLHCGLVMFDSLSEKLQSVFKNLRGYGKLTEKNVADALREEVNPRGIKVTSIYLGRTATPMP